MVADLGQDLRYGVRALRGSPGFTAMVGLSLALGIGANAAIFSVFNAVMLRPLPSVDPARLVLLADGTTTGSMGGTPLPERKGKLALYSYPLYQRLRTQGQSFEGLAAEQSDRTRSVVQLPGEKSVDTASVRCVSANYFQVLGVRAAGGRTFLAEDETAPGANPVAVLSHRYWQRRFGGNPTVIGSRLAINGGQYTVVGVTAPGFAGSSIGDSTDLWVPLTMQAQLTREKSRLGDPIWWWLLAVGKTRPGVSVAAAEAEANVTLRQFVADVPALARDQAAARPVRIALEPGAQGMGGLRQGFREPLVTLMAAVGLLLLIGCLNVSHLLLARAIKRQREMSIRTALGATRARLIRQLLTEGLLLSTLGIAAGALATRWLSDGLLSLAGLSLDVGPDGRVVSFTVVLGLATAALLGVVPAWQAARANLQAALQTTSHAVTRGRSRRLVSRALLTSQVAFSLVLLVGAGLLTGSLRRLRGMDKGFDEEHVLVVSILPRMTGLSRDQAVVMYDDLERRLTALPGVHGASLSIVPLVGGGINHGDLVLPGGATREVQLDTVTAGYFETVGMTMLRGRGFTRADGQNAPGVVVVNETLARGLLGGTDAVGQHFRLGGESTGEDLEVVGVVRDARTSGLRRQPRPMAFLAVTQKPDFLNSLEVRAAGDPALLADQVRAAVQQAYPSLPVPSVRTMASRVEQSLNQERLLAVLSTAFGLTALFLVCIGLYGVISQWAGQRTQEIGLRMALGATTTTVHWMVLRQSFVPVLAGVLVGLPAAMAASRLIRSLLFGVTPVDPATLTAATAVMFAVAALAAYLPARRASRVDPMMALRCE
jgi:predicted permease